MLSVLLYLLSQSSGKGQWKWLDLGGLKVAFGEFVVSVGLGGRGSWNFSYTTLFSNLS